MIKIKSILKQIEYINVFYLFISLNPFLLWIISPPLFTIPIFGLLITSFLFLLSRFKLVVSKERIAFSFMILTYGSYLSLPLFRNEMELGRFLYFVNLAMLVFYDTTLLVNIYKKMRNLIFFFCIISIVVFVLVLIKLEPPYHVIPGFSVVMQNLNADYKLYGLVVSSSNTIYNFGGLNVMRICGPFLEPGHFAIYIGVICVFEKIIYNKFSPIFAITGLLTFSPGFIFFLGLILFMDIFFFKRIKGLLLYLSAIAFIFLGLFALSEDTREQFFYLLVGRNFEDSGYDVATVLDDRAGKQAMMMYENYLKSDDVWFGKGIAYLEDLGVLSDYRGIIFVYGYVGFFICLLLITCLVLIVKNAHLRTISLFTLILIISHRSWMMNSPFVYGILFIGSMTYLHNKRLQIYE